MGLRVHHTGLIAADIEKSLIFYRDGVGLQVLSDHAVLEGDWPAVFGVRSTRCRSISLGDREDPSAGILELLAFEDGSAPAPKPPEATNGFLLVSFLGVDVDAILGRLRALGYSPVGRADGRGPGLAFEMTTVRDPDGVLVELVPPPRPL